MTQPMTGLAPRFVVETGLTGGPVVRRAVAVTPGAVGARLRLSCLAAVAVLAVLNAADVATTHALSRLGGTEVNPVANWLLERGALEEAKLGLVALIAALVLVSGRLDRVARPLWWATWAYSAVVALNGAQLLRATG
jgi:hypothetical protein